ncbi:hypothetical protein [Nostocoides veronense]|uniref:Uncharacterized protein n=1 Tax=Nostocoides veronense TaxID=330836 RepID=A0ABN2LY67_9MICO
MNDHDPIEEFFARERGAIEPLPGGEDRWHDIVGQARARRAPQRRWIGYAAAVAAAATLAGTGGWLLRGSLPGGDGGDRVAGRQTSVSQTTSASGPHTSSTSSATPSVTEPTTSASRPTSKTSTINPTNLPVPQDFSLMSMSYAGKDTILALGSGTCSGRGCATVIRSTDNGKTWNIVASVDNVESPGRGAVSSVGTDNALTGIRMANPEVGWIFGGRLMKTTDGGSHWEAVEHDGQAVVDLATNGTDAVLTVALDGCDGTKCSGDVSVQKTTINDMATREIGRVSMTEATDSADVEFTLQGAAIVQVAAVGTSGAGAYAVAGDTMTGIDLGCGDVRGSYVAASGGALDFRACRTGDGEWSFAKTAQSSGQQPEFTPIDGSALLGPGVFASFAATGEENLVAASGGRSGDGRLLVSHDGGQSWQVPAVAPPIPERGWRWVASPGASWYYAIPADGFRGFWRSTDQGETWEKVGLG